MSLEPVRGWGVDAPAVGTAVDDSPIIGAYTDCAVAPDVPYFPSRADFRKAGSGDARRVLLVPLTVRPSSPPRLRSRVKRWVARAPQRARSMLYPTEPPSDPQKFWDLAARRLVEMKVPYLSLAIRTDCTDSGRMSKVFGVLEALTTHPIAERLQFTNPLELHGYLTPPRRAAG